MTERSVLSAPRLAPGLADGLGALRLLVVVALVVDAASTFVDLGVDDAGWSLSAVVTTLQLLLAAVAAAAVMWLRPRLSVTLCVLVLMLALTLGPTSEELWLLVIIAVTVGARADTRILLVVATAQLGYVVLFGVRVERRYPGQGLSAALIAGVFCLIGYVAGAVARVLLRSLEARRLRLAELEQENAEIRATERLRLADDLQTVVTGGLAAIDRQLSSLADQTEDAAALRRGLDGIDRESRSVLTELRALLEVLRRDPVSAGVEANPPTAGGPRRWIAVLTARHVRMASSAGFGLLAVRAAFDHQGTFWTHASSVQTIGWIACAIAVSRARTGAVLAAIALVVSLAAGTPSYWSALPTAVLFFLGALRTGVRHLWLLVLALAAYGALIAATSPDWANQLTAAGYAGALSIIAGLGARHFVDVGQASARRHAGLLDDRGRLETDERTAVARDLHDVVAHQLSLTALMIMGTSASTDPRALSGTLQKVADSVEAADHELSTLLQTMRGTEADPVQTTPLVLPSAGAETFARRLSASGFQPIIEMDQTADDLDVTTQRTLGRIMQEATTNIVRYAPSGSVCEYALAVAEDRVRLTVASPLPVRDGKNAFSLGWGLRGIAERVELSHGTFAAAPRRGRWVVDVTLPRLDDRAVLTEAGWPVAP